MDFVPMLVLTATLKKMIDFVRYVRAGDINAVAVQLLAWAGGIGLVALAAHTAWAGSITFGDFTLAKMNFASQTLGGIALGNITSLAVDVIKAHDNNQSAAVPPLLP